MLRKWFSRPTGQNALTPGQVMTEPANSTQAYAQHLQADLDEALRRLDREKGNVRAVSIVLYGIAKVLNKAGKGSETVIVVREASKFLPFVRSEASEEGRLEAYENLLRTVAIKEPAEELMTVLDDGPQLTRVDVAGEDKEGWLMTLCESVLEDTGDIPKAQALVERMHGGERREYAYGSICRALARQGRLADMLELADQIGDAPPRQLRYFVLRGCVAILCENGAIDEALRVAKGIPAAQGPFALLAVSLALAEHDRSNEALTVLREALTLPVVGRSDQEGAFLSAAQVRAAIGDIDGALAEAAKIERERPRYSMAIAAISKITASKGDMEHARRLASTAYERDVALLGIVAGLTSSARLTEAEGILKEIKSDEQRWDGLERLALGLARAGRTADVLAAIRHLPSEQQYKEQAIVTALAESLATEGKYQEARRVIADYWRTDPFSRVKAMAGLTVN